MRTWKVSSWKIWSWKVSVLSWKDPSEVGKNWAKLEGSVYQFNFPTSIDLSNFNSSFPTALILYKFSPNFRTIAEIFELERELSNFDACFPTSFFSISCRTFQLKTFHFLVFPTALSNYTNSLPRDHDLRSVTVNFLNYFLFIYYLN